MPTAPDRDSGRGNAALVILDMLNLYGFDGGMELRRHALAVARAIRRIRDEADILDLPVIHVNDNFGQWHSEKSRLVEQARECAPEILALLEPRESDYFVIKPQFSGFYATNLPVLLPKLGVSRLVLTGIAADICVLFTAADAHMRDYALRVPRDAVAAETEQRKDWALGIMRGSLGAETADSEEKDLKAWMASLGAREEG